MREMSQTYNRHLVLFLMASSRELRHNGTTCLQHIQLKLTHFVSLSLTVYKEEHIPRSTAHFSCFSRCLRLACSKQNEK